MNSLFISVSASNLKLHKNIDIDESMTLWHFTTCPVKPQVLPLFPDFYSQISKVCYNKNRKNYLSSINIRRLSHGHYQRYEYY